MVKPFGDYNPPEGWVKFETLKPGDKFHDVKTSGMSTQFIKIASERWVSPRKEQPDIIRNLGLRAPNAVNLDNGEQVFLDHDEFVYPIDAGWVAELACYGFNISEELKAEGHRAILAYVFSCTEARKANDHWCEEIAKYLPQINVMSFAGAAHTIRWLMDHVEIKPEYAKLAANLLAIQSSTLPEEEKTNARLQAIFPNLGPKQ